MTISIKLHHNIITNKTKYYISEYIRLLVLHLSLYDGFLKIKNIFFIIFENLFLYLSRMY